MKSIHDIVPDPEVLLSLGPEEVAGVMLESFNSNPNLQLSRHNFGLRYTVQEYPEKYQDRLLRALMTGWNYLEREGLIAEKPASESSGGWYFVTERGKQISKARDLSAYKAASQLPKYLLHPTIAAKVEAPFLRGEYDTVVFVAMKEVEVGVRAAGGFAATDIGTNLMRKAFNPATGSLSDPNTVDAERQALSDLFAGAIGSYKNPHSHRNVALDAIEAIEIIVLASHLLKIVASRI